MGKHSTSASGIGRGVVAIVIAVVLGLVGFTWMSVAGGDGPEAGPAPSAAETTVSATSASPTSGVSGAATSSTTSSTSSSPDPVGAALAVCREETAAGAALAVAAAASARDWDKHTGAELAYQTGDMTFAEAGVAWAASKKHADRDVAAFAKAKRAYAAVAGSCGTAAAAAGNPAGLADCRAAVAAAARLGTRGGNVNDQWAAHVAMMKRKPHGGSAAYHRRWLDMVEASRPALTAYRSAAKTYAATPDC